MVYDWDLSSWHQHAVFEFKLLEKKEQSSLEYGNKDREVLGLQGCVYRKEIVQWKIMKRISTQPSLGISDKAIISHLILVKTEHSREIQMLLCLREWASYISAFSIMGCMLPYLRTGMNLRPNRHGVALRMAKKSGSDVMMERYQLGILCSKIFKNCFRSES